MPVDEATLISLDAVEAAARAIAEAFGLGDDTNRSTQWPIDEGDSVIAASVTGDASGFMLLAVDDDVAAGLTSDTQRLTNGFHVALDALMAASGASFELGEIGSVDVVPRDTVEIVDQDDVSALFALHLESSADADVAATAAGIGPQSADDVADQAGPMSFEPTRFTGDGQTSASQSAGPLSLLHDVDMNVTVELGRTTMPIRDLLALQPGMVIEIDRTAGTPIDVLVNGRLIACGEVVVIDEEFGVRITEIVSTDGAPT